MDALQVFENKRQQTNKPCALILISVIAGIVTDSMLSINLRVTGSAAAICSLAAILLILVRIQGLGYLRSALLVFASVCLGAFWHHLYWNQYPENEVGLYARDSPCPAVLKGIVLESPDLIPAQSPNPMDRQTVGNRSRFRLRISRLRDGTQWISVSGIVVVTVGGTVDSINSGDEVKVVGLLTRPPGPKSRFDFDLRKHYRMQRVNAIVFAEEPESVTLIRPSSGFWPTRVLDSVRAGCLKILQDNLTVRSYRLVAAMLLGERYLVSKEVRDRFLVTGTAHLLAISGLHVSILCLGFVVLVKCGVITRKWGLIGTILFVAIYCVLTGLRPPVLRASILVALYCWAKLFGKNPISVNSLSLAALIVIVTNPSSVFQPGTQLSFIAVATLVMVAERLEQSGASMDTLDRFLLRKRSQWGRIRDSFGRSLRLLFVSSLMIWIATLPLVSSTFHLVSVVGVLANVLLMFPITLALYTSFLLLLAGGFGLGSLMSGIVEFFLNTLLRIIELAASIPLGHCWTSGVGPFWLTLFYGLFALFFFVSRLRVSLRINLSIVLIWCALFLCCTEFSNQQAGRKLIVTFIDVSHGTSVLVEFPNGAVVLYDAGSLNSSRLAVERVSAVLWERKIVTVDALILSHADLDHYNAVPNLCDRFQVRQILVSPFMFRLDRSQSLVLLHNCIHSNQIPLTKIDSRSILSFDQDCKSTILHPSPGFFGTNDNANSLVWLIEYEGQRVLLTGDLEANGQTRLLSSRPIPCGLLMAPHHGSPSADHVAIAKWAMPEHVVISCGQGRLEPSVVDAYSACNARIQVTAESGAVTYVVDETGIRVVPFAE